MSKRKSTTDIRLNQMRRCIDALVRYRKAIAPTGGIEHHGVSSAITVLGDMRRKMRDERAGRAEA